MAGKLDEAIETHLLYTALWTRYSAMPERWSTATGGIEHGLRWWGGRPEWIESTWYLYQATKDPWYLHVGEMALRDIKRRCWTKCGWAGLQDVRTGELNDRMESFFLGETAKYLFLLFDPSHPLNTWDAPFVFTTEGHPLIIPKRVRPARKIPEAPPLWQMVETCPLPPAHLPFSISATAARNDVISLSDIRSPSNYTYYPWTLPPELIPYNATSSPMAMRTTFDLSFPNLPSTSLVGALQRVQEGILVNSMSGLRLGMVREHDTLPDVHAVELDEQFRIYAISNIALGRDEKVFMARSTIDDFNPLDPYFTRTRDTHTLDLVMDIEPQRASATSTALSDLLSDALGDLSNLSGLDLKDAVDIEVDPEALETEPSYLANFFSAHINIDGLANAKPKKSDLKAPVSSRYASNRPGAAPMPDIKDAQSAYNVENPLIWTNIYVHPTTLCSERLPMEIVKHYQVVAIPRGDCSFSTKLQNIPAYPPDAASLQLVIIISFPEQEDDSHADATQPLIQPLLDQVQYTPSGILRPNPIPLVMVGGGQETMEKLKRTSGLGLSRRYYFRTQGVKIGNLIVV
ncbi:glycoside hydrolase family 47 protein [Pyrenophora tritici-repentis]|nr:glycoside hydrolase family 47 protein [Pyrenophora tritici-repentis]